MAFSGMKLDPAACYGEQNILLMPAVDLAFADSKTYVLYHNSILCPAEKGLLWI